MSEQVLFERMDIRKGQVEYARAVGAYECPSCKGKMQPRTISNGAITQTALLCDPCGIVFAPNIDDETIILGTIPLGDFPKFVAVEVSEEDYDKAAICHICPECGKVMDARIRRIADRLYSFRACDCGFVVSAERLPDDYENASDSIARGVCPQCSDLLERRHLTTDDGITLGAWACPPCDILIVPKMG